jgi:hypothetical protein
VRVTIDLGVAELAATRFAISPLSETVSALQQLGDRDRQPGNLRWLRWAVDRLAGDPLDLSRTWPLIVTDRPSWPEFLIPAPVGAGSSIEDDLAALQATTARQVRGSLGRVFGDDPRPLPPRSPRGRRPACGRSPRNCGRRMTGSSRRTGPGSGPSSTRMSAIAPNSWPAGVRSGCSPTCTRICSGATVGCC